jgi:putative ABC transport system permease protein
MSSSIPSDVTFAFRQMRRQPLFTLVIMATLAIGIGANTAMFALVHGALLKPLPYKDPDRLVLARRTLPGRVLMWNSGPDFYDYREQVPGFETLAAASAGAVKITVTGGARPERVATLLVSHDLLSMLGIRPLAGRLFTAPEGVAGSPYVAVVAASLAERRFGSVEAAVGRTLAATGMGVNAVPVTVVGVLPRGFRFLDEAELWVPMRRGEGDGPETRRFHNWVLIGRLKPGLSMAAVQSQVDVVSSRLQQQYPETNKVKGLRLDPLQAALLQSRTPRLMMVVGATGLVLLIACINVAGMLLARGVARRSEVAVRAALGATRARIGAQLVTESLVLSGLAGAVGLLLAVWLRRFLPSATGLADAGVAASGLEGPVLMFALLASLATGAFCGAVPALRASSRHLVQSLAPGVRATASRGGARLRSLLVIAQVTLSLVLLVGAGLLVRSLSALTSTDLGFNTKNLLATAVDIPLGKAAERIAFQDALHDDLAAIPGVEAVTFTSHTPILHPFGDPPMYPAKRPPTDSSQERTAFARRVLPGFFKTLGIRLRSGRDLSPSDRMGSPLVLVVNTAFAREFFPGENPLGQHVIMPGGAGPFDFEIVGVVEDARTEVVAEAPFPSVYISTNQQLPASAKILIRSSLPPAMLTETVRKVVAARNRDIPVDPLVRMDDLVGESLTAERVVALTLASFSTIALLLAAVGLYGVLSQHVGERTHEFGVLMALGAARR